MFKSIKLAIVGSREVEDYELLKSLISLFPYDIEEIISGGALGVDTLARRYALENNIPLKEFLPDWQSYGKAAGIIRNRDIISHCDYALILWDGKSRGTANDILLCKLLKKPYYLHNISNMYRIYSIGIPDVPDAKYERGFKTWVGMLKRLTTKDTYKDVKIDPSWLMFSQFQNWYISQSPPEGFEMDKDLLSGHLLYSPYTCVYLPKEINLLLLRKTGYEKVKDGFLPVIYKEGGRIKGEVCVTEEDARKEYIRMKKEYMEELVWKYSYWLREDILQKLIDYDFA